MLSLLGTLFLMYFVPTIALFLGVLVFYFIVPYSWWALGTLMSAEGERSTIRGEAGRRYLQSISFKDMPVGEDITRNSGLYEDCLGRAGIFCLTWPIYIIRPLAKKMCGRKADRSELDSLKEKVAALEEEVRKS